MIIATRTLTLHLGNDAITVPIVIHAPEQFSDDEWRCHFEIGWPQHAVQRWGTGGDGIQALLFALQMIGAQLYASEFHERGQLSWETPGTGYGFPVTNNIRDVLVGDDKRYL